jgi:hypothetical protein
VAQPSKQTQELVDAEVDLFEELAEQAGTNAGGTMNGDRNGAMVSVPHEYRMLPVTFDNEPGALGGPEEAVAGHVTRQLRAHTAISSRDTLPSSSRGMAQP